MLVRFPFVWVIWTAMVAAVLLVAACGDGEDRPNVDVIGGSGSGSASVSGEEPAVTLGTTFVPATNQDINLAMGLDLRDIRAAMAPAARDEPADWAEAQAIYENGKNQIRADGTPRSLASIADAGVHAAFPNGAAVYGRPDFIDGLIRDGLSGTGRASGMSDNARRQLVDKGIQMLMYSKAVQQIDLARSRVAAGAADAMAAIDEAWAVVVGAADPNGNRNNALLATAAAREEDFMLLGKLAGRIESTFVDAARDIEQGDTREFNESAEALKGRINGIFYLGTLRYATLLERDATAGNREMHLAEGWASFQAIRATVAAASPDAAQTIEAAFTRPASEAFPASLTKQVYDALNQPDVRRALGIQSELQVAAPR
ncbi:MAG: hypothetical protein AB7R89_19625 [Dehalococcoidia bacterium]